MKKRNNDMDYLVETNFEVESRVAYQQDWGQSSDGGYADLRYQRMVQRNFQARSWSELLW